MIDYIDVLGDMYSTPETRAEALLRERLSPVQLEDYERTGEFNVKAQDGKYYRILVGHTSYNVIDPYGYKLCAYPIASLPQSDRVLATMLMLEGELRRYKRIANKKPSRGDWRPHGEKGTRRVGSVGVAGECRCDACGREDAPLSVGEWLAIVCVIALVIAACFLVYSVGATWLWTAAGCLALCVANLIWLW